MCLILGKTPNEIKWLSFFFLFIFPQNKDSPEQPTDPPEPAGSSVIEEADQTSEEEEAATDPTNECQNPIDLQETQKTDEMQLFELLAKRFNTMSNALKSVDSFLKTSMEK